MLRAMRLLVPVLIAALFPLAAAPAQAKTVFHATCGDLRGQRVDMDPDGRTAKEDWKYEFYKQGPAPDGQGTLEFIAEEEGADHLIMKWTGPARSLPIVFKSDSQISAADVDEYGVWMFTLFYRAGKVLVTRQTTNPGAIGAILVGNCAFEEK